MSARHGWRESEWCFFFSLDCRVSISIDLFESGLERPLYAAKIQIHVDFPSGEWTQDIHDACCEDDFEVFLVTTAQEENREGGGKSKKTPRRRANNAQFWSIICGHITLRMAR